MEKSEKDKFGSRIGFVLAAAGSAVGLGNIWRFPYLAAKYGGAVFLFVYIALAVTFGFALVVTEVAIGRKTGRSVLGAYGAVKKKFKWVGLLAAAVPMIIVPYYCVIGGWVLKYLTAFITGNGAATAGDGSYFSNFIGSVGSSTLFFVIFVALTALVVAIGIKKGIEASSKVLMPVLLVLIVGIAIYTLTRPGAMEGLKYYLLPNFEGFTFSKFLETVAQAMGQLFYSMSIAMGIMITYGSYMSKKDSIENSVRQIEVFDTAVAILAGLIIVPAVFAFSGGDKNALNAGPSLMFITLPNVFKSMPGGNFIGALFFLLVALAALTSSIALMETVVAVISKQFKVSRAASTCITVLLILALGCLSVFGYSIWDEVRIFGYQILDFFDFISNSIMMPIVTLCTCILIGYHVKTKYIEEEVMLNGQKFRSRKMYRVMIKTICPICMIIILITPFISK